MDANHRSQAVLSHCNGCSTSMRSALTQSHITSWIAGTSNGGHEHTAVLHVKLSGPGGAD